MAVINTLASDVLALRGADSEYHRISRFFRDRGEALAALDSGDWEPTDGLINACLIGYEGIALYDPNGDTTDTVAGLLKPFDQSARAYTDTKIAELIGDSPETLNTLQELAEALSNNPDYISSLATRITDIEEGPVFTGAITAPVGPSMIPFYFDSVASFPDAISNHGGVAHAHETGLLYYSHGGDWIPLAKKSDSDAAISAIGVPTGDYNLGNFTGNTIADGSTVKEALQSLESAHEANTTALPTMIHASWDASSGAAFDFATNGIASSGVDTVSRQAEGIYRVEFTTAFATNAYTVTCGVGSTDYSGTGASPREVSIMTRTAEYVEVICERSDDAVNEDNFYMSVIIMG